MFLVGASGAGKTTLLYTLAGLERPEAGTVEFEGRRLYQGSAATAGETAERKDGLRFPGIFSAPGIDRAGKCHAAGNDRWPARSGGGGAAHGLREVGLGERMQHLPAELSGGEQQRVAIARALTNDPDIIFADEPTGNLDSKTGDTIIDLLLNLARERRKTLLVVTHDSRLAARGDRELRIVDGVLG